MSEWWSYRPQDFLLFSPRAYWRLFELQNEALWPLHLPMLAVAAAILVLVLRRSSSYASAIPPLLAAIWLFVGWSFLWSRYAAINWAIDYVAPLFLLEAALLLIAGTAWGGLAFDRGGVPRGIGLLLAFLGVVAYPLLPAVFGRAWPEAEIFGLAPDPTAIATLGFLLAARGRLLGLLFPIPLLWLLFSAATLGTMGETQAWLPLLSVLLALAGLFRFAAVKSGPG